MRIGIGLLLLILGGGPTEEEEPVERGDRLDGELGDVARMESVRLRGGGGAGRRTWLFKYEEGGGGA